MSASPPPPVLGLSLGDRAALTLATTPESARALEIQEITALTGTGIIALGGERHRAAVPAARHLDPLFTAQALLARFPGIATIVSTAPGRDHPYNLARRVLSLDHFSGGRIGLSVGTLDHRIDTARRHPWTTEPDALIETEDLALVLRELWRSWPSEAIIADRETGRFAETSAIRSINHRGAHRVAGALTTPSSPLGEPPLLWRLSGEAGSGTGTAAEAETAARAAELVIVDGPAAPLPGLPTIWDLPLAAHDGLSALAGDEAPRGLLLRLDALEELPELIERLDAAQARGVVAPGSPRDDAATLRERLDLPQPELNTAAFTPAFERA